MDVISQVRSFVSSNFYVADPNTLKDDSSLLDGGVIDSTGVLEVVAFLETQFQVKVEDEEMLPENLDSISKIANFVERKKAARA